MSRSLRIRRCEAGHLIPLQKWFTGKTAEKVGKQLRLELSETFYTEKYDLFSDDCRQITSII